MFDFLIRKSAIKNAQKFIDELNPKVNVHIPEDLPLPSVHLVKKTCLIVSKVNGFEDAFSRLSNEDCRKKTAEFKDLYQKGIALIKAEYDQALLAQNGILNQNKTEDMILEFERIQKEFRDQKQKILSEILPEAYALVREAGKRILNMRHFDVQILGGIVLNNRNISEMTTGEGKTLVATLPVYLNALTGEGAHVVTVNDYLAKRDSEWMGPLYQFLGLSVGVIQHDMSPNERQKEYAQDITYGTNNEFGFDYLRDNMVNFKEEMSQRGHHFAIVDEVDSILVDEARTPLIISGPAEASTDIYYRACEIAKKIKGKRITERDEIDAKHRNENLSLGVDYLADEKAKSVSLSEDGELNVAKMFGIANIHDMETMEYRHQILQALKAKEFFKIDVDYVVNDGQVIIVDEFTGRLMPGRRWSDGLHQAIEAKEGIKIERENQTLATITLQNYFRMYEKLGGMTGTAYTEANEFKEIYNLDCVVIPPNRKVSRLNHPDSIYKTMKEKFNAVIEDIIESHKKGRPVLVGTISIEKSELLGRMLKQKGIPHQVLNAKYHETEANIIAQAGRYQAVTIATNMAGRGTDILLGGNAEFLAKQLVSAKLKDVKDEEAQAQKEEMLKKFIEQFRQQVKEEHDKVVAIGGLHVIGTERHESRRIDNQLRGRQGRQGDPGSSRFYVSLEDDLMRLFASDRIVGLMDRLGMEEGQVLEHPWLTGALETAQKRVENHNFEIRKHLIEYDDVMNRQREVIYALRRTILESTDVKSMIWEAVEQAVDESFDSYLPSGGDHSAWDIDGFKASFKNRFNHDFQIENKLIAEASYEEMRAMIIDGLKQSYASKEQEIGIDPMRHLERMVLLNTIDSKWKDHLYAMDHLKEGIGLRSYAQRNPLVEYKKEGFEMFEAMYRSIHDEVADLIYKLQPAPREMRPRGVFSALPKKFVHHEVSGLAQAVQMAQNPSAPPPEATTSAGNVSHSDSPKVGRNDPCPCGSGKKYKKCCGQ